MKACTKCRQTKPLDSFSRNARAHDGLEARCRACRSADKKAHYLANREREIARRQAYHAANPDRDAAYNKAWRIANADKRAASWVRWSQLRRARVRERSVVPFTQEQLSQRMSLWGDKCWICRKSIEDGKRNVDHVKPLSRGGCHMLANLRPAHETCNKQKGSQWPYHPSQSPEMEAPRWRLKSPK